jgi:hypothetical protein
LLSKGLFERESRDQPVELLLLLGEQGFGGHNEDRALPGVRLLL